MTSAQSKEGMGERRCELATFAAPRQPRWTYCMLARGRLLADQHLPAALEAAEIAAMDRATKIVDDATSATAAEVERLPAPGEALTVGHPIAEEGGPEALRRLRVRRPGGRVR